MKLTTRGNYAISALLELASQKLNEHMSLGTIATKLDLSENYLRQLFMQLRKAGIVDSVRGVGGGYYVAKELTSVRVLDIVEAVEGSIYIVPCLNSNQDDRCSREESCSAKCVWQQLNESVRKGLMNITLQGLVDEYLESLKKEARESN